MTISIAPKLKIQSLCLEFLRHGKKTNKIYLQWHPLVQPVQRRLLLRQLVQYWFQRIPELQLQLRRFPLHLLPIKIILKMSNNVIYTCWLELLLELADCALISKMCAAAVATDSCATASRAVSLEPSLEASTSATCCSSEA